MMVGSFLASGSTGGYGDNAIWALIPIAGCCHLKVRESLRLSPLRPYDCAKPTSSVSSEHPMRAANAVTTIRI